MIQHFRLGKYYCVEHKTRLEIKSATDDGVSDIDDEEDSDGDTNKYVTMEEDQDNFGKPPPMTTVDRPWISQLRQSRHVRIARWPSQVKSDAQLVKSST